ASAPLVTSSLTTRRSSRSPQGLGHGVGVPTGAHHRVAGGQGGFDEIDAHATAGPSNEPDLPVSHGILDHSTQSPSFDQGSINSSIYLHKRGSNQSGNFSEFARIPNRENGFA